MQKLGFGDRGGARRFADSKACSCRLVIRRLTGLPEKESELVFCLEIYINKTEQETRE